MKNRILSKSTLLYKGTLLINIDKSENAIYWVNRQGMEKVETIALETGEKFDIWRNYTRDLACAVPV